MRNPFSIFKVKRLLTKIVSEKKHYFTLDDAVASSHYLSLPFVMQQLRQQSPGLDVVKIQRDSLYSIARENFLHSKLLFYRWLIHLAQGPSAGDYTIDTIILQGWEPFNKAEVERRRKIKNQDFWPGAYASAIKDKPIFSEGIILIGHRYFGGLKVPFSSEVVLETSLEAHYSFRDGDRVFKFAKMCTISYWPNILTRSLVHDWLNDNLRKITTSRVYNGQTYLEPLLR